MYFKNSTYTVHVYEYSIIVRVSEVFYGEGMYKRYHHVFICGILGVATGFVHLSTPLESWDTKFSILFTSKDRKYTLASSEWKKCVHIGG